jgi:hypothetical protein
LAAQLDCLHHQFGHALFAVRRRERQRLLYAVTWPAAWLDERGLTCAPQRYQTLIEERLQIIAAHGDCTRYDAYFPSYLGSPRRETSRTYAKLKLE